MIKTQNSRPQVRSEKLTSEESSMSRTLEQWTPSVANACKTYFQILKSIFRDHDLKTEKRKQKR